MPEITKDQAIKDFTQTLEQGLATGKITLAHIWALNLLLDANNYQTPTELVRAKTHVAIKPLS